MHRHPYLRAYMAGIAFPTAFFLVLFSLTQFVFQTPAVMQRALMFPLAFIPNLFGLWNVLYVKLQPRWHHSIGLQGAVLPFIIAPLGLAVAVTHDFVRISRDSLVYFDLFRIPYGYLVFAPFIAVTAYYLIWKYIVGYLNDVLELPR